MWFQYHVHAWFQFLDGTDSFPDVCLEAIWTHASVGSVPSMTSQRLEPLPFNSFQQVYWECRWAWFINKWEVLEKCTYFRPQRHPEGMRREETEDSMKFYQTYISYYKFERMHKIGWYWAYVWLADKSNIAVFKDISRPTFLSKLVNMRFLSFTASSLTFWPWVNL